MAAKFRRMTYSDRLKLEALYNAGVKVVDISQQLGFHYTSVYKEIKNGLYNHKNHDWTYSKKYSADRAEQISKFKTMARARDLKVGNDYQFISKMEHYLLHGKYSPSAALKKLQEEFPGALQVSYNTIYRYIDSGIFPHVTRTDLPFHGKRIRKKKEIMEVKQPKFGRSIDERPAEVEEREVFGHWELDTVIGKQQKGQTMLVMTERKTNYELIFRSDDKTLRSTVLMLDRLEQRLGSKFSRIFKTITCDNGSEFSNCDLIERSSRVRGKRTAVYYCHPYSSWERGSNEKQNQMLRRRILKGTRIEEYTDSQLRETQNWLNTYPRKKYDWKNSQDLFIEELATLGIKNFSKIF